jgi:ABC-type multidrug transport system ATPase subunit
MPCCTETNKTHTLLADSITLSFGRQNVLNGAWLRSETGRVTGLLGRNGSGKSSMFRAVMGQLKAQNCFVRIDDEAVPSSGCGGRRLWMTGPSVGSIFRKGCVSRYVKYLPQGSFLPPKMTLGRIFEYFAMDYGEFVEEFPKFGQYRDTPVNLS